MQRATVLYTKDLTSLCFSSNLYVTSTEKKFAMIGASVSLTAIKIS